MAWRGGCGGIRRIAGQKEAMAKAATEARDWTQRKGHRYRKLTERERAQNRCKSRESST